MRSAIIALLTAALAAADSASPALAQNYPDRPIRWINPYPPGGANEVHSRIITEHLSRALGQPIVIENRIGSSGVVGSEFAARSAPDGYTLVLGTSASHAICAITMKGLTYDPVKDFRAVILVAKIPNIVAVHPSLPLRNFTELLEYLRAHPNTSYGSPGPASSANFAGALLRLTAQVVMNPVPYRGGGQAVSELRAGAVKIGIADMSAVLPYHRNGQVRALAVTAGRRSRAAPDLPTVGESGIRGFDLVAWIGLFAPAKTPDPVVLRLNSEVSKIIRLPEVNERLANSGSELQGGTPEEFQAFVLSEIRKWRNLAAAAGFSDR